MLENSNIILICIIVLLILFFAFGHKSQKIDPVNKSTNKARLRYGYKPNKSIDDELMDEIVSCGSSSSGNITREALKPNYLNIQFHNDYRDVLTAINNIIPKKRQRFNLASIPIKYSEPPPAEIKQLMKDFIKVLNVNILEEVPNVRNKNSGFDELIPNPTIRSGFEEAQKPLGLPRSLYEDPACKAMVRLIAVERVQKYETEDEIRYVIQFVLQKMNVNDQLILKASFVQDKRPLQDEDNFFVTKNIDMRIIIEDIFVIGVLSDEGPIDTQQQFQINKEKYFDYNKLEENQLTDPKYIQKMLMKRYRERSIEMQQRNDLLDEEGRDFYRTLPSIYDYSNITGTRTIFDDMNKPKHFD